MYILPQYFFLVKGPPVQALSSSSLLPNQAPPSVAKVAIAPPIITLFDTPTSATDQSEGKMTETQKKVQRLKASFANPFEMVSVVIDFM